MARAALALALLFSPLAALLAVAAENVVSQGYSYRLDQVPAWVVPTPPSGWPGHRPQPGWHYVLNETQVALDPTTAEYTHVVRHIDDATGLQGGANFEAVFDPAYQRLVLHDVAIYRGSERIDVLRRDIVTMLRREQGLERLQYDGKVTASVVVPGLRVGDRLSYRYTVEGSNPVFGDQFSSVYSTRTGIAASQWVRLRFVTSSVRRLNFKAPSELTRREGDVAGGLREVVFERRDAPKLDFEPGMAPGAVLRSAVFVSQHEDWNSVARWGTSLFDTQSSTHPAILALAKQLREQAGSDPLAQAETVLNWVQREIRYFGVFFADSSHRPNPAPAVLEKRFGDCKDKAQLTIALLRAIGISSRPILVSQMFRSAIGEVAPNPLAFDHVIVEVAVGDRSYWLDPTRTLGIGPIESRQAWTFGLGLPLDGSALSLKAAPPRPAGDIDLVAVDRFLIADTGKPVELTSELTYFGEAAEMAVTMLSSSAREQAEAGLFLIPDRILQNRSEAGKVDWTRNDTTGAVTVRKRYRITELFELNEQRLLQAEFLPWMVATEFRLNPAQRTDFFLGAQRRIRHAIEFKFGEAVFASPSRTTHAVADSHFRMKVEISSTQSSATGTYDYETLADVVPLSRWSAFSAKAKEAAGKAVMTVRVPGIPIERRAGFLQRLDSLGQAISRKEVLAVTNTQIRARASEVALSELLDHGRLSTKLRAEVLRQRAMARDHVDDRTRAVEDTRSAAELDTGSSQIRMTQAETLFGLGQFSQSNASVEAAIASGAAEADVAWIRGRNRLYLSQFDDARNDFRVVAEARTGPTKAFPQLWYAIASIRNGAKPGDSLREIEAKVDGDAWPQVILAHYLGQRSERDVLREVDAAKSDGERRERLCEASFFLGQLRLSEGDTRAAIKHFEKAIDTEVWEYIELPASRFELERIRKGK